METDFLNMARQLTGRQVDRLILCKSGRNSRVYKVVCGNDVYALKSYPSRHSDPRDRFGTEIRALRFYQQNGNPYAPKLLATGECCALMEWIEGSPVTAPEAGDIDQAVDFMRLTHAAVHNGGELFGPASEPCLSGAALFGHIERRIKTLFALPELQSYLNCEIAPLLDLAMRHAENPGFSVELPKARQSLIPADFGFHNAIKTADGRMRFIDFEYFGWDDPVRLAADFLLHPSLDLDAPHAARFSLGMKSVFHRDADFESRLLHLLPLYGLRWALILLNEFIPERWANRVFAGESASWQEIKALQLKKSRIAADKVRVHLT